MIWGFTIIGFKFLVRMCHFGLFHFFWRPENQLEMGLYILKDIMSIYIFIIFREKELENESKLKSPSNFRSQDNIKSDPLKDITNN